MTLDPIFPCTGGKRLIADRVWEALGTPRVYVEPFAGSLAVLLARPHKPGIETVNDRDGHICNVWRAVKYWPQKLAELADYPVSELDLFARHQWLVDHTGDISTQLADDPKWCDVEAAAWWIWGASQWIGGGWCTPRESEVPRRKPATSHDGKGVHRKRPMIAGSNPGKGVQRQMPSAHGLGGAGVHAHSLDGSTLAPWFEAIANRLRKMRIVSGDFARVLTKSTLYVEGSNVAAVFLDPPYSHDLRSARLYAHDDETASARAREWAIAHGDDKHLRIVLAGLEGEHDMPASWLCVPWTGAPGLGRLSGSRHRERLWLSPHCREINNGPLFQQDGAS